MEKPEIIEQSEPETKRIIKEMTDAELVQLHSLLMIQVWSIEHELEKRGIE